MSESFGVGDGLLFMKVGTHAKEPLADIITRKRREINEAGYAMWGYGGNSCHPRTMVQPFAAAHAVQGRPIRLVMKAMDSRHYAEQVRAEQYSVDGINWEPIPQAINVLGSRFALCIKDLQETSTTLALNATTVALGNSRGRPGSTYLRGHVDKACLEVVADPHEGEQVQIHLVAKLAEPYAVILKN